MTETTYKLSDDIKKEMYEKKIRLVNKDTNVFAVSIPKQIVDTLNITTDDVMQFHLTKDPKKNMCSMDIKLLKK